MDTITTTLTAPGERVVKTNGTYAGLITREREGWMWTGSRKGFPTFTDAAHYLAHHPMSAAHMADIAKCSRCRPAPVEAAFESARKAFRNAPSDMARARAAHARARRAAN